MLTRYIASAIVDLTKQFKRLRKTKMKNKQKVFTRVLSLAAIFAVLSAQLLPLSMVSAQQITMRKLELIKGAGADYGSEPSGIVDHRFSFTVPTADTIGSISFEYCTLASGTPPDVAHCDMPADLDTTTAALGAEVGASGFTINNTTNGMPYITRPATGAVTANLPIGYTLQTITNPSATNTAFFVRIKTYSLADMGGVTRDAGVVAASTATPIHLEGIMPESLVFCTGATIDTTIPTPPGDPLQGLPDCGTASAGDILFDQLFSPTDTAITTSQMAASTNATHGYAITVNGLTLMNGSYDIAQMGSRGPSSQGTAQFGLNVLANNRDIINGPNNATVPVDKPAGAGVYPASGTAILRGTPAPGYGTTNEFKFTTGDTVATSDSGDGAKATDAQIFTVTYIANVPGSQAAGTYATTLTYIATPLF